MREISESETFYYHGVIAALAVVHSADRPVIYDEIVNTVYEKHLIAVARRSGNMRWSGLSAYLRRKKQS